MTCRVGVSDVAWSTSHVRPIVVGVAFTHMEVLDAGDDELSPEKHIGRPSRPAISSDSLFVVACRFRLDRFSGCRTKQAKTNMIQVTRTKMSEKTSASTALSRKLEKMIRTPQKTMVTQSDTTAMYALAEEPRRCTKRRVSREATATQVGNPAKCHANRNQQRGKASFSGLPAAISDPTASNPAPRRVRERINCCV